MADEKKTDLFGKDKIVLQAKPGFSLPVRYQGAWVRVTKDAPVEFVVDDLPYEAKIEIRAAIKANHIVEATMPAPAAPAKAAAPAQQKASPAPAAPAQKAKE